MHSFPPCSDRDARVLVLGSMPGRASLQAQQYYAHPRNGFWFILEEVLGITRSWPYERRLAALRARRIALWDVLHSCRRPGSLDADIDGDSAVVNDFAGFFARHPRITRVYFNGTAAEALFRRHVRGTLGVRERSLVCVRLPSTSPANASWPMPRKVAAWRVLGEACR